MINEIRSPTGNWKIRNDSEGSGEFGAKRGWRFHESLDFELLDFDELPEQPIYAPISGIILRIVRAYKNDVYRGVIISDGERMCRVMYFLPTAKIGQSVIAGDQIGIAQDISKRYNGNMKPHIDTRLVVKAKRKQL